MKICSNCGTQNNDSDLFCAQCGAALTETAQPDLAQPGPDAQNTGAASDTGNDAGQQYAPQQQYNGEPVYGYAPQQPQNPYPLLQTLKKLGSGTLFLAAIICATAQAVVSLISSFLVSPSDMTEIYALLEEMGIDSSYFSSYLSNANSAGMIIGELVGMIPAILIIVGLWMIYTNCRKKGGEPLATTGFSLIRGVTIFEFVVFLIIIAVCMIVWLICFGAAASYMSHAGGGFTYANAYSGGDLYSMDENMMAAVAGFWVGFLIALLFIIVFVIIYYIKLIGSIKRAKEIIVTGTTKKNVSSFVGVMQIIAGVMNIISGLIGGLLWATILSGVTSLLFGILIMKVRKEFEPDLRAAQQNR